MTPLGNNELRSGIRDARVMHAKAEYENARATLFSMPKLRDRNMLTNDDIRRQIDRVRRLREEYEHLVIGEIFVSPRNAWDAKHKRIEELQEIRASASEEIRKLESELSDMLLEYGADEFWPETEDCD